MFVTRETGLPWDAIDRMTRAEFFDLVEGLAEAQQGSKGERRQMKQAGLM